MTQIDPSTSLEQQVMPIIQAEMEKQGKIGPGTWISGAVVVVQTETVGPNGKPSWRRHRLPASGVINPELERGLLRSVLRDAEREA